MFGFHVDCRTSNLLSPRTWPYTSPLNDFPLRSFMNFSPLSVQSPLKDVKTPASSTKLSSIGINNVNKQEATSKTQNGDKFTNLSGLVCQGFGASVSHLNNVRPQRCAVPSLCIICDLHTSTGFSVSPSSSSLNKLWNRKIYFFVESIRPVNSFTWTRRLMLCRPPTIAALSPSIELDWLVSIGFTFTSARFAVSFFCCAHSSGDLDGLR